ncbi:MAG TPA: glycosyltransferase family 39 protein, partial [Tepidisphaeraceae bacterium]|nr:glycosyltransferase family 39 protein [Tepidisphaeraceae bacterium]
MDRRAWPWIAAALVVLIFVAQLWAYFAQAYYAGIDEATYFLTAKSMVVHHSPEVISPDPLIFVPGNMNEIRPGFFVQKYPIGFPLLVAIGYQVGGQLGAFLVNPALGCIALLAAMAVTWELAGAWPAVLVGLVLALHPLMVSYSIAALSHMSDLACVVAGLWCLWRWGKRGGIGWSITAGMLLGYAVSIRYTEALMGLVVVWVAGCRLVITPRRAVFRDVGIMTMAGLVALIPLLVFQWRYYGSPFHTGYGLTGESTAFSWHFFRQHVGMVLGGINEPGYGLPGLFPIALVGFVVWLVMLARNKPTEGSGIMPAGFLFLWIVPSLLLYVAYYWSAPEPTLYMRLFLIPYVGLTIAAIVVLERVTRHRIWLQAGIAVAIVGTTLLGRYWSEADALLLQNATLNWTEKEGADVARAVVPPDAVLIGDDWMAFDLVFAVDNLIIFPRYFDADWVAQRLAAAGRGGPQEFNALRAKRFLPLLAGRNQAQLDELFRQEIRRKLDEGKMVALLTTDLTPHGQVDRK